jgi:hypothetical protein
LFTAVGVGDTLIIASLDGVVTFAHVSVTSATLDSITLTSPQTTVAVGFKTALTATGLFSDSSEQDVSASVAWQSLNSNVASVSNAHGRQGSVTALQPGSATIRATLGGISADAVINVSDAVLDHITVQQVTGTMSVGRRQPLSATGHYSDSTSLEISSAVVWSSSASEVASVSNGAGEEGVVTALGAGSVTITASIGEIGGSTSLTIEDDPNAPVSIGMSATPNVILNNGVDASQLTIILQPAGSNGQIADNTEITVEIVEGDSRNSQTLYTSNGSASLNLSSNYLGFIAINVSLANGVTGSGYVVATGSFSDVIVAGGILYADYNGNILTADSWFMFLLRNLSNRDFQVVQYEFSNGDFSNIYPGDSITDGVLNGGEQNTLTVVLSNDQEDRGLVGVLTLGDSGTGESFDMTANFTAP